MSEPTPIEPRRHGPADPRVPLFLDSPHSGSELPDDMRPAVDAAALADGTDTDVDQLWLPATERGCTLVAARALRTYIDCNRHEADVDLDLVEGGAWPDAWRPSGKARIGKSLVWRTLDDGTPIYDRLLPVDEVRARIRRHHRPYHDAVRRGIEATHARFGRCLHVDCHSMNAVGGAMGEGGAGQPRADIVLGDRDGTSCDRALTDFAAETMRDLGYDVRINDPFKGVELVRAYADPRRGRHSLQIEVNKRLYLHAGTTRRSAGYATLQRDLARLVDALLERLARAPG